MKFFLDLLFWCLLFETLQGSTLPHRRPIRALNTTLITNFNGTYERRNPCSDKEVERSSYIASHELHHHTKEDNWSHYTHKCSAIISNFLQSIGNLIRSNHKTNGCFNFYLNTSISQKQDFSGNKESCDSLPTIIIETTDCKIPVKPCCQIFESPKTKEVSEDTNYQIGQLIKEETVPSMDFSDQEDLDSRKTASSCEGEQIFKNQLPLTLPPERPVSLSSLQYETPEYPLAGDELFEAKENLGQNDDLSTPFESELLRISSPSTPLEDVTGTEQFSQGIFKDLPQVTQSASEPKTKYFKTSLRLTPQTDPENGSIQPRVQFMSANLETAPSELELGNPIETKPNVVLENSLPESGGPEPIKQFSYPESAGSPTGSRPKPNSYPFPNQQPEFPTPTLPSDVAPQIPISIQFTSQSPLTENESNQRFANGKPEFSFPPEPQSAELITNKPLPPEDLTSFTSSKSPESPMISLLSQPAMLEKPDKEILPTQFKSLPVQPFDYYLSANSPDLKLDQKISSGAQTQSNNFLNSQNQSDDINPHLRLKFNGNIPDQVPDGLQLGDNFPRQPLDADSKAAIYQFPLEQPPANGDYSSSSESETDITFSGRTSNSEQQLNESLLSQDNQLDVQQTPTLNQPFQEQPNNNRFSFSVPPIDSFKTYNEDILSAEASPPPLFESNLFTNYSGQISNDNEEEPNNLITSAAQPAVTPFKVMSSPLPELENTSTSFSDEDSFVTPLSKPDERFGMDRAADISVGSLISHDFDITKSSPDQESVADSQSNMPFRSSFTTSIPETITIEPMQSTPDPALQPYFGQYGRDAMAGQVPEEISPSDPRFRSESVPSPYMIPQTVSSSNVNEIQVAPETFQTTPLSSRQDFQSFESEPVLEPDFKGNQLSALYPVTPMPYEPVLNPDQSLSTSQGNPTSSLLISSPENVVDNYGDEGPATGNIDPAPVRQTYPSSYQPDFQTPSPDLFLTRQAVLGEESAAERPNYSVKTLDYTDQTGNKIISTLSSSVSGDSQTSAASKPFFNASNSSRLFPSQQYDIPKPNSDVTYEFSSLNQNTENQIDISQQKQASENFEVNSIADQTINNDFANSQIFNDESEPLLTNSEPDGASSDPLAPSFISGRSDPQFASALGNLMNDQESFSPLRQLSPDRDPGLFREELKIGESSNILPLQEPYALLQPTVPDYMIQSRNEADSEPIFRPQNLGNKFDEQNPKKVLDSSENFSEQREQATDTILPLQSDSTYAFPDGRTPLVPNETPFIAESNGFSEYDERAAADETTISSSTPQTADDTREVESDSAEMIDSSSQPEAFGLSTPLMQKFDKPPQMRSQRVPNSLPSALVTFNMAPTPEALIREPTDKTSVQESRKTEMPIANYNKLPLSETDSVTLMTNPEISNDDGIIPKASQLENSESNSAEEGATLYDLEPQPQLASDFMRGENPSGSQPSTPFISTSPPQGTNDLYPPTAFKPQRREIEDTVNETETSDEQESQPMPNDFGQEPINAYREPIATDLFPLLPSQKNVGSYQMGTTRGEPTEFGVNSEDFQEPPFPKDAPFREEYQQMTPNNPPLFTNLSPQFKPTTMIDKEMKTTENQSFQKTDSPPLLKNTPNFQTSGNPYLPFDTSQQQPETEEKSPINFELNSLHPLTTRTLEQDVLTPTVPSLPRLESPPVISKQLFASFNTQQDPQPTEGKNDDHSDLVEFPSSQQEEEEKVNPVYFPRNVPSQAPTQSDEGDFTIENSSFVATEPLPNSNSDMSLISQPQENLLPEAFDSASSNFQDKSMVPRDQTLTELQPDQSGEVPSVNDLSRPNFNSNEFSAAPVPNFYRNDAAAMTSDVPPEIPQQLNLLNKPLAFSQDQPLSNMQQTRPLISSIQPLFPPSRNLLPKKTVVEEIITTENLPELYDSRAEVRVDSDKPLLSEMQLEKSAEPSPAAFLPTNLSDMKNSDAKYPPRTVDQNQAFNYSAAEPIYEPIRYFGSPFFPQDPENNYQQVAIPNQRLLQVDPENFNYQSNYPREATDIETNNAGSPESFAEYGLMPPASPILIKPIGNDEEINSRSGYPAFRPSLDSSSLEKGVEIPADKRTSFEDQTQSRPQEDSYDFPPEFPNEEEIGSHLKFSQNTATQELQARPQTSPVPVAPNLPPPAQEKPLANPLFAAMESMALPIYDYPYKSPGSSSSFLGRSDQSEKLSFDHKDRKQIIPAVPPRSSKEWDPQQPTQNSASSQSFEANTVLTSPQDALNRPQPDPRALVPDQTDPSNGPGEDYVLCCGRRIPLMCPFNPTFKGNMTAPSYYILVTKLPVDAEEERFQVEKVYLGDGTPLNCTCGEGKTFPTSLYTPVPYSTANTVRLAIRPDFS